MTTWSEDQSMTTWSGEDQLMITWSADDQLMATWSGRRSADDDHVVRPMIS